LGSKNLHNHNQSSVLPFGGTFNNNTTSSNVSNVNSNGFSNSSNSLNIDKSKFFDNHLANNNHYVNQDNYTTILNDRINNTNLGKQNCKSKIFLIFFINLYVYHRSTV
jgi:hypothetical protein